jgi:hypothetical protein
MSSKLLTMRSRRTAACRIAESRFAGRGALETQGAPQKFAPENQGRSFCFFDPGGRRRAAGAARSRDRFNQTSLQKHASLCSPARAPCRVECDPLRDIILTIGFLGNSRRTDHDPPQACSAASSRSTSTTRAPAASIASVLASPMPDAPPVTAATLPSNSFAIFSLLLVWGCHDLK